MDNCISKKKQILYEILFYIVLFLVTFCSYYIFKPRFSWIRNGVVAQIFALFGVVFCISAVIALKKHNQLTTERLVFFMILISYFIRLGYMLYTSYDSRQYDTITSNFDGHEGYALTIFSTGKLPDSNVYQFYHPPLNAAIQALFMKINEVLMPIFGGYKFNVNDIHQLYQTCQILSVMYTMVISVTSYKILKELKFQGKSLLLSFAFLCFFPRFIQLAGQLNNDLICIMFCFLTIYYTIKWYHKHSFSNIILLAIFIGLAMNSKISGAVICIPTAIIFVLEFIKSIKKKEKVTTLCLQYVLFLLLCAPIGLWFQIYAKIRFDQPFGYVFNGLNSELSTADHNLFERIFLFINFDEIFGSIFPSSWDNYCLLNYALKSAIFGEFAFWQGESFAVLSIFFQYLFFCTSLVLFILYFIRAKKEDFLLKLLGGSIIISQVVALIYFYIQMPYGCTMDFRYIVPIVIGYSIFIGAAHNKFEGAGNYMKYCKFVEYMMFGFLLFSNLFYLVCI